MIMEGEFAVEWGSLIRVIFELFNLLFQHIGQSTVGSEQFSSLA